MDKVAIAKDHLIPKILKDIGLGGKDLVWDQGVLKDIIKAYSKDENGVRGLEQVLRTVITKVNTARFIDDGQLKDVEFPLALLDIAAIVVNRFLVCLCFYCILISSPLHP